MLTLKPTGRLRFNHGRAVPILEAEWRREAVQADGTVLQMGSPVWLYASEEVADQLASAHNQRLLARSLSQRAISKSPTPEATKPAPPPEMRRCDTAERLTRSAPSSSATPDHDAQPPAMNAPVAAPRPAQLPTTPPVDKTDTHPHSSAPEAPAVVADGITAPPMAADQPPAPPANLAKPEEASATPAPPAATPPATILATPEPAANEPPPPPQDQATRSGEPDGNTPKVVAAVVAPQPETGAPPAGIVAAQPHIEVDTIAATTHANAVVLRRSLLRGGEL